ncbi:MAG: hypothetical protein LCH73_04090 [Proteobacteria bacterium]|nr:hypothetical protein [Pseudomonadota bacterium]
MKPATEDLAARRPVWEALSDLFLDTDTSLSRAWRVQQLAHSPYTIAELQAILVDEVYPICRANLLSVAGEWSGFDLAWLEGRILRRLSSRFRCLHGLNLGRLTVPASTEWRATRQAVVLARAADTASAAE